MTQRRAIGITALVLALPLYAFAQTEPFPNRPVRIEVASSRAAERPGQAGLSTLRLECGLAASLPSIRAEASLVYVDRAMSGGIAWRELTARGEGTTLTYLSHSGPDQPNPPEYDPAKLFARIFGGDFVAPVAGAPPVVDPTRALRRSVPRASLG